MGYNLELDIDYVLPRPTEDELNLGALNEYFDRVVDMNLDKKYKITQDQLGMWIHHNYNSVFLLEEELSLKEFRKLN
jgi:predicted phosphoribosyltransferase